MSMDEKAGRAGGGASTRMSAGELRASLWLASLYAIRMLGLFLVMPVFVLHAAGMPGGDDAFWVGLAFGLYGLTQAAMQIPFGAASDRFGRKPVITVGLLIMLAGSIVAALAETVPMLALGRALQGAGAVSAAISALVADSTRDVNRSKAMALIGVMIALSYALSLVIGPVLYEAGGLSGIFVLTAVLALVAIGVLWKLVPEPPPSVNAQRAAPRPPMRDVLDADLWRLNLGIFVLHLTQMALFVVLPARLLAAGLPIGQHWQLYLPVVVVAFLLMLVPMRMAERGGRMRAVFLGGVMTVAVAQAGFLLSPLLPEGAWLLATLLLVFFVGFNLLEALLPSLVSRLVPPNGRGLALGVYSTCQSLGVFAGGALGGLLARHLGDAGVFVASTVLLLLWWAVARQARRWPVGVPAQVHGQ
ncbi:MAG: MFS transporter [Lautropia sp.]|nr:MFS transporter [Lautropia sp.]